MAWTTPATPVTLTVITVAFYNVNIRDNLNQLRANTGSGDPGAAGLSLESDTATSAAWVGGKVSRAGDVMTGDLQVNRSGSAAPTTGYLIIGNNGAYYIGFDGTKHVISTPALHMQNDLYVYRIGAATTGYLILGNNAANYIGFDGTNVVISGNKVWHQGNDGSGSGLDADLLRGLAPGSLSVASATTAGSATTAASAASASDSAALGGVAASGYARIFSGTYAGNGAATLDIPLSFTPKLVFVQRPGSSLWTAMPSNAALQGNVGSGNGEVTITLTTNKFVASSASGTNTNAVTYTYVALG